MSYVTPITDRAQSDIDSRTSKGFWNVSDWTRVYGNSYLISSLVNITPGYACAFILLNAPTVTTIPTITDFNNFLTNIETLRNVVYTNEGAPASIATAIKDNYVGGLDGTWPNYADVNYWETVLDAIWNYYSFSSIQVCPTLTSNLTLTNFKIYIDCLDMGIYSVDTGVYNLYII